jgi:hypothetical protein
MSNEHHDAFSFGFAGMLFLHSSSFIELFTSSGRVDDARQIGENAD